MRILMVFDLSQEPEINADYRNDIQSNPAEEWKAEASVYRALTNMNFETKFLGLHGRLENLLSELETYKPDLVFNLFEAFRGDRAYEPHVPALLELLQVPYTGEASGALGICKDKGLAKRLVAYDGVKVPLFVVSKQSDPLKKISGLDYPLLIKPLGLEASSGISQDSLVYDEKSALERIEFLHTKLKQDAMAEEFIDGRELYVSVFCGGNEIEVFPPRELFFDEYPENEPRFATHKAKWDEAYRKKWGIRTGPCKALAADVWKRIQDDCRKICKALSLKSYARMDLRLSKEGVPYFLEVNPNPSLAWDDDFARSAKSAGYSYDQLIERIISCAVLSQ